MEEWLCEECVQRAKIEEEEELIVEHTLSDHNMDIEEEDIN
jgi:hypothetical protein